MSKKKLVDKLKSNPKDFIFDETESLLKLLGYAMSSKGKTSGSRVKFTNKDSNSKIYIHKPHPRKELLDYQIKQLTEELEQEGLICISNTLPLSSRSHKPISIKMNHVIRHICNPYFCLPCQRICKFLICRKIQECSNKNFSCCHLRCHI